jgi:hypothetical protein
MPHRLLRTAGLSVLLVGAAGCSWFGGGEKHAKLICPSPYIAPNLDTAAEFRPGGGTSPADIRFGVKLIAVNSNCQNEKVGLRADTTMTFVAARSDPTLTQGDFTYFVAIADAAQNIQAKKEFSLRVEFAPRQNRMQVTDRIAVGLPLRDVSAGGSYAIIVGLQLNQEQLDFNRRRAAGEAQQGPTQQAPAPQAPRLQAPQ